MKKLVLLIALSLSPNTYADGWIITDVGRGAQENGGGASGWGLDWCNRHDLGNMSSLLQSICEDGFAYANSYTTCNNSSSSCSSNYSALSSQYTQKVNAYNTCAASYNDLLGEKNSCASQYGGLAISYNANEAKLQQSIAYGNTQANLVKAQESLIKKLKKACGAKCKKIK